MAPAVTESTVGVDVTQEAAPRSRRRASAAEPRRSPLTRVLVVLIALAAIASAALPYVSQRYSALASGATDLEQMESRASTAEALDPTSIEPFAARADAYSAAASVAPDSATRLPQLLLAAEAWQQAIDLEPGNWVCRLEAARALFAAREAALFADPGQVEQLDRQAKDQLAEARRLNPLSPELSALDTPILEGH